MTLAIALGSGFLVLGGGALATPGVGILSAPVHARGTLARRPISLTASRASHWKTKGSVDVATQQIVIDGGGSTGWHSHPGPVLVTVKSGALRLFVLQRRDVQGHRLRGG